MWISDRLESGKTCSILIKLLLSFIHRPDLNSCETIASLEVIFICCAFFSVIGVTRSPTANVNNVKNNPVRDKV